MNKTTKTILIILGSLLLICACGAAVLSVTGLWSVAQITKWADTNTTNDLADVAQMANEIAIFTLPDGFGSPYGMHIGDITSIGFASQSKDTHILITQFPEGTSINVKEMLKLISQYSDDSNNQWYGTQTTVIEEKPVTIRGQQTTLSISEGTSSEGGIYRSAVATFQGKRGPALLVIAGPVEEWDMGMVDTFVASIQ